MKEENSTKDWLEVAQRALEVEIEAIKKASTRLDGSLTCAAEIILAHDGKVVVSGIGKSGHIAQKIAATLCSTGTPAVYLHPADASHGDLGVYTPGDPSILISKSGSTAELVRLVPILRQFNSPLIAIVGNLSSALVREADVVLDARVEREADPLGVVPTASAVVALALGDALASALMYARRLSVQDYGRFHPGGQIGRNLWLHVADIMHQGEQVAWVEAQTPVRDVVIALTEKPLGAACVVDENFRLLGLITDGDVRRALKTYDDIRPLVAQEIMTEKPVEIHPEISLKEALQLMESRSSQISVLPVVARETNRCLGLLRLHDIYQAEIT
ncbi:MAG: KpsF/GutQ family sugar-phosphate isomerase [Anaerolineales bacterium]|nr:KpsF/GutQ family sugar-phosphate isomerase [Anaerolineales bacterium]